MSKTINVSTTTYSYDATGQLVQAGGTTYTYDANGNPTGGGNVIGSDNELPLSDGTLNYTYDAAGNRMTQVGISNGLTWTYTYNDANRMTSAVETTTATGAVLQSATYVYDVIGNLQSESVTTWWNHDRQPVCSTRGGRHAVRRCRHRGDDRDAVCGGGRRGGYVGGAGDDRGRGLAGVGLPGDRSCWSSA